MDDDERAASQVQARLAATLGERFLPRFEASRGREGLVTIQGAPEADTEAEHIIAEGRAARELAPNATPKIPATAAGLAAMEVLAAEGHPIVMTEVFSLAQLNEVARRHAAVTTRTGRPGVLYVAAITGTFPDRLRAVAPYVERSVLQWAGIAFARRCSAEVVRRRLPFTLLFGGARVTADFTGLVGNADHITINHSTVAEIIAADPPVHRTIDEEVPDDIMAALTGLDEFRQGMSHELPLDRFADFGPVQHFRDNFITGWHSLRAAVAEARARTPAEAAR